MKPCEIALTMGMVALVDQVDFRRVAKRKWCVHRCKSRPERVYAQTNLKVDGRWVRVLLHRFIMGDTEGKQIDHKDGNGLNCTRSNMRLATHQQNMRNQKSRGGTSRFKGVSWHQGAGKWTAQIAAGSEHRYLGLFRAEEDAARAYDAAAQELHGEFAWLNFPEQTRAS